MKDRIKAIRKSLKLSQRKFGEKLGVSRDVISNMEYGRVQPKEHFLIHLCELYGVNPCWLKNGEGEMFNHDIDDTARCDEALQIFKSLRPEFQDYALNQIKGLAKLQEKR